MFDALLNRLADWIEERPWQAILTVIAPVLLLTFWAPGIHLDLSFGGAINKDEPEFKRFMQLEKELNATTTLMLLIEGEETIIQKSLPEIYEKLEANDEVARVFAPIEPENLKNFLPYLKN